MKNISAVVLTKNEGALLVRCLKGLLWCDETIVVDDNSIDKTIQIAKKFGARVYKRELRDDFSAQRNFALKKLKSHWALFIDADEFVSQELAKEIKEKISNPVVTGYYLKRRDYWLGKYLRFGESGNIRLLRLARSDAGKWRRIIHETWDVPGKKGLLKNPSLHYPHPSVRDFLKHVNFQSQLHAKANFKEGKRSLIVKIIIYPSAKFILNYFFRLGFLDGIQGLVMAVVMSFHSFLSWSELWLIQRRTKLARS